MPLGLTLEPGMLLLHEDGTSFGRVWAAQAGQVEVIRPGGVTWVDEDYDFVDLQDPATFLLAERQLYFRLGVTPGNAALVLKKILEITNG